MGDDGVMSMVTSPRHLRLRCLRLYYSRSLSNSSSSFIGGSGVPSFSALY
jgi:hypothetical protein